MKAGGPMKPLRAAAKSFRYFALRLFLDRKALFSILLVELACLAFCLIVAVSIGSNRAEYQNPLDALPDAEYLEYCLSRYEQASLGSTERSFFQLILETGLRPNDFIAYTGENLLNALSIENSDAYQVICFAPMAAVPPMYLLCYSLLGSPESRKAYKNASESRMPANSFVIGGYAMYFAASLLIAGLIMLPSLAFKAPTYCLLLGDEGYFFLPSWRIFAFKAADSLLLALFLSSVCLFVCNIFANPMDSMVFGFASCLLLSIGLLTFAFFDLSGSFYWSSFLPGFGKGFDAARWRVKPSLGWWARPPYPPGRSPGRAGHEEKREAHSLLHHPLLW